MKKTAAPTLAQLTEIGRSGPVGRLAQQLADQELNKGAEHVMPQHPQMEERIVKGTPWQPENATRNLAKVQILREA